MPDVTPALVMAAWLLCAASWSSSLEQSNADRERQVRNRQRGAERAAHLNRKSIAPRSARCSKWNTWPPNHGDR